MNSAVRAKVAEAIQSSIAHDEEMPEGSMLMGWVTIAEWMTPEGNRWLTQTSATASGEQAASWQVQGYLHNALNDDGWANDEDDEE